jgi:hypothetical protein
MRKRDLIVLVHGIDSPLVTRNTLANLSIVLRQQASFRDAFVLTSQINKQRTRDGIETLATRLVWEIEEAARENGWEEGARGIRLSLVGHSLGGIVCRYAAYLLHAKGQLGTRFVPVSFVAIGSPHLGVRRASTMLGRAQEWGGELLYGGCRTMDELMLRDKPADGTGVPLLMRMAAGDFLTALSTFRLTLVSAIAFDHQVTHCSSAITLYNQYSVASSWARYALSWVSSAYPDRLCSYSGFGPEYESVLGYHRTEKRHTAVRELNGLEMRTYESHARTYTSHPHEVQRGDAEVESQSPLVMACARGLQTLPWRRLDFEMYSMFVHDALVASPTLSCCGLANPTRYGWKVLGKIAKVMAVDQDLHEAETMKKNA